MNARVYAVSLWAPDLPVALRFYRDVIGLLPILHHGDRLHFDLNGTYLAVLPGKQEVFPAHPDIRFPLVAIALDDFEAALARLSAEGVDLPWGIEQGQGMRWAMCHDPAGNLIELVDQSSQAGRAG